MVAIIMMIKVVVMVKNMVGILMVLMVMMKNKVTITMILKPCEKLFPRMATQLFPEIWDMSLQSSLPCNQISNKTKIV